MRTLGFARSAKPHALRATRRALPLATAAVALLLLARCSATGSAGSVADKFVDKYYVEADQQAAEPLAAGVALLRLKSEIALIEDSRRGIASGSHSARVYYERTKLSGEGKTREADYALRIQPQGTTGSLQRDAHLEVTQQEDGSWKVTRFSETTPPAR